jgi:hypothetical protein
MRGGQPAVPGGQVGAPTHAMGETRLLRAVSKRDSIDRRAMWNLD